FDLHAPDRQGRRIGHDLHEAHAARDEREAEQREQEGARPARRTLDLDFGLGAGARGGHHGRLPKLVARIRSTRRSKDTPTAAAAIGTSEWSVMPGTVLSSMSHGAPAASSMKSTRPQPAAPSASKA